jgi:hypothetical protein
MGAVAYDTDFCSWSLEQADLLQKKKFDQLDFDHLVEELQSMSAREHRELVSRLRVLMMHLLKWQYQPALRGNSWRNTIVTQAEDASDVLEQSPSLKFYLPEMLEKAYPRARRLASQETGLNINTFPKECPYDVEKALSGTFFPD